MAASNHDTQTISADMDYAQHDAMWHNFTGMVTWSIIELGLIVLALYSFIFAGQPWFGGLLMFLVVALPLGAAFLRSSR